MPASSPTQKLRNRSRLPGLLLALTLLGVVSAYAPSVAQADHRAPKQLRSAKRPAPGWLTDKQRPIAHRGLHNAQRPENSMPAFRAAVKKGLPIELDVHLLSDGKLAVFHDKKLGRMTRAKGQLRNLTSVQLKRLRLLDSGEPVPTLDEVLKMVQGRVPVLVEMKGKSKNNGFRLESQLNSLLRRYEGESAVMGFSARHVIWFRRHAPDVLRGQLAGSSKWKGLGAYSWGLGKLLNNPLSDPDFIAHDVTALPSQPVASARKAKNKPVLGWTVRSRAEQQRVAPYVDNFIFEGF